MIDEEGYRLNVGIIVANEHQQLLWAKRLYGKDGWQFPQGGMRLDESPQQAMFRELEEELGLLASHVKIIKESENWYAYELPKRYQRTEALPLCIGQKQKWFLLKLLSDEAQINVNKSEHPEFSSWRWVDYWFPLQQVIDFKKKVYQQALAEFEVYLD